MKPLNQRQGSEQQLLHSEAMELYARIIRPADNIESWLSVKNACETFGPDSVIENCIDNTIQDERDLVLLDRAIGACIYQYFFGSETHAERGFYAAYWLLTDVIHGFEGTFFTALDCYGREQLTELANFGFRITNTATWGFNSNGPDNMYSLAWVCRRAHESWLNDDAPFQLKALETSSNLSLDYFSFAPYFHESQQMIKPCMYMSLEDALWFVISVVHQYPLDGLSKRIDGPTLLYLLEDLYDEYLNEYDITRLEGQRNLVMSGSGLSNIGYESFNFDPSENSHDEEISEKVEILGDFFDRAIDQCKKNS